MHDTRDTAIFERVLSPIKLKGYKGVYSRSQKIIRNSFLELENGEIATANPSIQHAPVNGMQSLFRKTLL